MKIFSCLVLAVIILMTNSVKASSSYDNTDFSISLQKTDNLQFANAYWLPDYKSNTNNNGRSKTACKQYDALASCPEPTMEYNIYYPIPGKTFPSCVKDCRCSPLVYKYTSNNCPSGFTVSGKTCNGKFETCEPLGCPVGSKTDQSCPNGYEAKIVGQSGENNCYNCVIKACPAETSINKICGTKQELLDSGEKSGTQTCFGCKDIITNCDDICSEAYTKTPFCRDGQTLEYCSSECGGWKRCVGEPCKGTLASSCKYPCPAEGRNPNSGCEKYCLNCGDCPVNDCSGFELTSIPNNATVIGCKKGCGNEEETFMLSSCNDGYGEYENYWCEEDLSCWTPNPSKEVCVPLDCDALGYTMTKSECLGKPAVKCPYNQDKIFCFTD